MKRVLVVCTGNSCRSIMAEYLINHLVGDAWQAFSAGVSPSSPHRLSLKALATEGIDASGARSKSVREFTDRDDLDLVITVCDYADLVCPTFSFSTPQAHIPLEDPIKYAAGEAAALGHFQDCMSDIREKIVFHLDSILAKAKTKTNR